MITKETQSEIRNLIVKANLALHRSDIGGLRELLRAAFQRASTLNLRDVESGCSLSLLDEE